MNVQQCLFLSVVERVSEGNAFPGWSWKAKLLGLPDRDGWGPMEFSEENSSGMFFMDKAPRQAQVLNRSDHYGACGSVQVT